MTNPTAPPDKASDSPASDPKAKRPIRPQDQDPKLWKGDGWTAQVIKNDDDDGWAVAMTSDGESEPALVGPWVMGRDKKNPKPLDANAFATLVKTANEILARHEQQRRAQLHRSVSTTNTDGERVQVDLDLVPDEDDPHAVLTVRDPAGKPATRARVAANFKLTADSARKWIADNAAAK